jgi:hypothetical protein
MRMQLSVMPSMADRNEIAGVQNRHEANKAHSAEGATGPRGAAAAVTRR